MRSLVVVPPLRPLRSATIPAWVRREGWAVIVLAAASTLAPVSTGGCPHQGRALDVVPPLSTTDEDADRLLREADRAADAGEVGLAEARYRELLTRHPDDRVAPLAHLGLGRIALALGRHEEALEALERAMRGSDPVVAERATLYRGVALHLRGRPGDAVPLLVPLVGRTANPEESRLLLETLAAAALATGAHVTALEALDAWLESADDRDRESVRERMREVASSRLPETEIDAAYAALRRSGLAWRLVAERALRRAHDRADVERVRSIARDLADRGVTLDGALATLVERAERLAVADVRVIGAILPLTGPARAVGRSALHGLMLAAGTPDATPPSSDAPRIVFRDDAGEPARAAQAVEELVAIHRAVAIVGPLDPACAEAAAARASELGVPLVSLAASEMRARSPLTFRLLPTLEEELSALIDEASVRGARRFAVLAPATGWGQRAIALVRALTTARGASFVAEASYAETATTFSSEVARIAAASPDAVVVADSGARIALLAPALATAGLWPPEAFVESHAGRRGGSRARPVQLLVPSVGLDARLARTAGRYLRGALFAAPFVPVPEAPPPLAEPSVAGRVRPIPTDLASFSAAYREQHRAEPDAFAVYAFDALSFIRRAVADGAASRAEVASWLASRSAGTPTLGTSSGLTPEGRPRRPVSLATLSADGFVPVAPR